MRTGVTKQASLRRKWDLRCKSSWKSEKCWPFSYILLCSASKLESSDISSGILCTDILRKRRWCEITGTDVPAETVRWPAHWPFLYVSLWPGAWGSLSDLCAVFSTSVAFVRLSPVTGLSDHCLSHESLAVIHVDAFQTARHHTNACSVQLTLNKWLRKVTQAHIIKSEKCFNMSDHSYEDSA